MTMQLDDVKREVAIANRVLPDIGLASGVLGSLGHVSMRVPDNPETFVVKGRGYAIDALARAEPEGMVVCDLDGFKVGGPPGITQCFEVKIHSAIFRARPDVQSIVHVHPRFAIVMGILGVTLVPMCREGLELVEEPVPVFPHSRLILTEEDGVGVAEALGDATVLMLQGHGAVSVGTSTGDAVMNMAHLEEQARMNWYAYAAAGPGHARITEEQIAENNAQPPTAELPHFRELVSGTRAQAAVGGVWRHLAANAAEGL